MNLQEIKDLYPQFRSMPDEDLARQLHREFYPQLDFDDFSTRIGYENENQKARRIKSIGEGMTLQFGPLDTGIPLPRVVNETLAGIGSGMSDLYHGAGQAVGVFDQNEVDRHIENSRIAQQTGAGKAGNIIGQIAATIPAAMIPGANTGVGATLIGGGIGMAQPTEAGDSRALNTVLGAAGGRVGKWAGDKVARMLGGNPGAGLNESRRQAMQKGEALGFKATPGQKSGSRGLLLHEAKMESSPYFSRPFDEIKDHNQTLLNRIAAKSIGEESDVVDANVLQQAQDRIGDVYKSVATDRAARINVDRVVDDLAKIEVDFEDLLPQDLMSLQSVQRLMKFAEKGDATGRQLQSLSSKLGKIANQKMTSQGGERDLGLALFDVKNTVDDLLAETLDDAGRKAFNTARGQYRNLMLLTRRNNVLNTSSGEVHGNALAGLLQQKDRSGFLFGRNDSDLYNAARFAQAFRPIVGDSGTATRSGSLDGIRALTAMATNPMTRLYTSPPVMNRLTGEALLPLLANNPQLLVRSGLLSGGVGALAYQPDKQ